MLPFSFRSHQLAILKMVRSRWLARDGSRQIHILQLRSLESAHDGCKLRPGPLLDRAVLLEPACDLLPHRLHAFVERLRFVLLRFVHGAPVMRFTLAVRALRVCAFVALIHSWILSAVRAEFDFLS